MNRVIFLGTVKTEPEFTINRAGERRAIFWLEVVGIKKPQRFRIVVLGKFIRAIEGQIKPGSFLYLEGKIHRYKDRLARGFSVEFFNVVVEQPNGVLVVQDTGWEGVTDL